MSELLFTIMLIFVIAWNILIIILIIKGLKIIKNYYKGRLNNNNDIDKGEAGEREIVDVLKKCGCESVLHNLYVPINNEGTAHTEIDAIAITRNGIFVTEIKNYGGEVHVEQSGQTWYQRIGNKINPFRNPLDQNELHVKAVKRALPKYTNRIKSLVVFCDRAVLISDDSDYLTNNNIMLEKDLPLFISKASNNEQILLTIDEIIEIVSELSKFTNVSEEIKKAHIENIMNRYQK